MLLAALFVFACKDNGTAVEHRPPAQFGGWYRLLFLSPGFDEVPVYLSIPADPTKGGAVVLNGKQWFTAQHHWAGERVEVDFSMYRTKILAAVGSDGDLVGTWEIGSRVMGSSSVPIRASRVDEPDPELKFRTSGSAPPEIDPSGVWKLMVEDSLAKLVLEKEGTSAIGGTIWFKNGDSVYLSGNVMGKRAVLSSFDGSAPYFLSLEFSGGKLEGRWTDLAVKESVTGKRSKDFTIPEPVIVNGIDRRLRLPELEDPRYVGFPVIVQLVGTWCSHCKSAAPVMSKLYETYQGQDLRMLTINYEFTEDKSYNLQRAAQYKNEYGITWHTFTREGRLDEFVAMLPTGITAPTNAKVLSAFPITLFLERDHTVHRVHSGFVGPESGLSHMNLVDQFETWTKEILK